MGSKSSAQGGKGKRKNNGPAEQRYKSEMRWDRNKTRRIAKAKREAHKHAQRHAANGTLGYRARQIARGEAWLA